MSTEINATTLNDQIELEFYNRGNYYFYGEVDADTVKNVVQWIINENAAPKSKQYLSLYINSWGGSLNDAFALIDIMKMSRIPIRTIGLGNLMSAAFMIFISGEKGNRVLTKNTSILCHQFSSFSEGKEHELMASMKEFRLVKQRMTDHIAEMCDLDERFIKKRLLPANDVWLAAEEAVEIKVADRIIEKF